MDTGRIVKARSQAGRITPPIDKRDREGMHMPGEALAQDGLAAARPAGAPAVPSEDEYLTFCAALQASARGRAFLAEYAKRNRGADTEVLLAALARLEAVMRAQRADMRGDLRSLLASIRKARPDIEASALPARAAKLALLLNLLERRLVMLAETDAPPPAANTRLAVVPAPDQPELPIPSPAAAPALTLAHDRGPPPLSASAVIIPEVTWLDGPPAAATEFLDGPRDRAAAPSMAEKVAAIAPQPVAAVPPRPATPLPPPANPLAALMLLSEEERLALFT
jgi:hypothetical protein